MSFIPDIAHSGYLDKSKRRIPYVLVHPIVIRVMAIFMIHPTFIMSIVFIPDASYAIAFAGVVNGNMNENEQMNTAGRQRRSGLMQPYRIKKKILDNIKSTKYISVIKRKSTKSVAFLF